MSTVGSGVIDSARERVQQLYGAAVGRGRDELVTPALVLDLDAAERNIARMAAAIEGLPTALRPHVKTHKSPDLAARQVAAGAIGLSTATVWEAIVIADAGLDNLFVVNTVAGDAKIRALVELARSRVVRVAVDDATNAKALSDAAVRAGSTLGVLIEVDTGMHRAGVGSRTEAAELAWRLVELPALHFDGVTGYEGHCALTPQRERRHELQKLAMDELAGAAEAIRATGIPVEILSAGGTATWEWTAADPRLTEIQAGTYVVMDVFHGDMVGGFEHALTVQSTVVSAQGDRVVIDAGSKSIADGELSRVVGRDLEATRFDEEHGIFRAAQAGTLRVGDSVAVIPGYAPSTVNWFDAYHVARGDDVIDIWPVIPRGPGHNGLARPG